MLVLSRSIIGDDLVVVVVESRINSSSIDCRALACLNKHIPMNKREATKHMV